MEVTNYKGAGALNSIHDVGGMDGFGPIDREENEPVFHASWEGRMRAIHTLISKKRRIYHIDESRHTMERIDPVYYLSSSYYQLWLLRLEALLMEKGVLTKEEIQEKMAQISPVPVEPDMQSFRKVRSPITTTERKFVITTDADRQNEQIQAKFSPGTVVKAKTMSPLGHTRIPRYVRGKQGVIEKIHGNFILPDVKVHVGIDLYQPVYLVRFEAQDLWGEDASPKDKLYIELWEDYMELGGAQ
jgi:nitrile hydratase beta subunit